MDVAIDLLGASSQPERAHALPPRLEVHPVAALLLSAAAAARSAATRPLHHHVLDLGSASHARAAEAHAHRPLRLEVCQLLEGLVGRQRRARCLLCARSQLPLPLRQR